MKRIGFFGGSFNPPHCGHQATILQVLETAQLDELFIAPVFNHPEGKELAPFENRMTMVQYMIEVFNSDKIWISAIERENWARGGRGLTTTSMDIMHERQPDAEIVLIMGSDVKRNIRKWAGYKRLKAMVDAGWLEFWFIDRERSLSSTMVRKLAKENKPLDRIVPRSINEYIYTKGLYR